MNSGTKFRHAAVNNGRVQMSGLGSVAGGERGERHDAASGVDRGGVVAPESGCGVRAAVHRRRLLEIRAMTASGDDTHAKAELEAYVRNTLAFRGFVDYRRSFEVAGVASEMLDELENHLNSGAAEIVRPA